MPSHPSVSKCQIVLRVSVGLSIASLGFDLACLGAYSFWVIPAAFLITVIHHIFLFLHLRRHPNQPHKVRPGLIYALVIPILAWLAGAACTYLVYYIVQLDTEHVPAQQVMPLVGGILAVFEAGALAELWRRCLMLSKESEALGMVNDISADRTFIRLDGQKQDANKQHTSAV